MTRMTFLHFGRLPTEFRLAIWALNYESDRVVKLRPLQHGNFLHFIRKYPPNLSVCQESRVEALQIYALIPWHKGYLFHFERQIPFSLSPFHFDLSLDIFQIK